MLERWRVGRFVNIGTGYKLGPDTNNAILLTEYSACRYMLLGHNNIIEGVTS